MRFPTLLFVLVGLVTACRDTTSPAPSPIGRYELTSVQSGALPHVLSFDPKAGPWIVRGSLELRADGRYTQLVTDSLLGFTPPTGTTTEVGTWSFVRSDSIWLAPDAGVKAVPGGARIAGDSIVRIEYGERYAYSRR